MVLSPLHEEEPSARTGFTQAVGDVELLSRPEGFSGAISLPLLPDLIQIYTVSLANGALTIRRGTERGTIWFEHGQMVHAECSGIHGEEAVYRMLQWHNGQFFLDAGARSSVHSITASWQTVLMEGCRRLDENAAPAIAADPVLDDALAMLERELEGFRAVAVFEAGGELVAQRGTVGSSALASAGPALVEMLRSQARVMQVLARAPSLLDCFWILDDQMHFIQPTSSGRVVYVIADRGEVQLALTRRAVDRVLGGLG